MSLNFVSVFFFYIFSYLLLKRLGCLSGLLVSSAMVQNLFCESWLAFKWSFDECEKGEWKSWLKLNIQKTKIMASNLITLWQMDGETVETVTDFILGVSKITYDDHSHEIKRRLLLGRKAMILDSILKSRDITLPTKIHLVKAMVFSSSHIWIWELDYKESWAPKNWCFWTVALEKILESLS